MSETAANFSIFIIEFCSNDTVYDSVILHQPNGRRVALTNSVVSAANNMIYIKSKQYTISNTTMIRLTDASVYKCNGQGYFSSSAQGVSSGGMYIGVTKVTGIR